MSRYYEMTVILRSVNPARVDAIKEAAKVAGTSRTGTPRILWTISAISKPVVTVTFVAA